MEQRKTQNSGKKSFFDGAFGAYLVPGILLQSVLIGGGYATGREVISYGAMYGAKGWIAGLATFIGFSIMSMLTFEFARVTKSYNYKALMSNLIGKFAILYDLIYIPLAIIVLAVMASATGEIVNQTMGLNYWVGVVVVIVIVGILNFYGTSLIERFETWGTVALYIAYIIFGVIAIKAAGSHIGEVFASGDTSFAEGPANVGSIVWLGIVYVAYNLLVYPSCFESLERQTTRKQTITAGFIAGFLMTVPWFITYIAFMGFYPNADVLGATVPWLVILKKVGGAWTVIIFGIVMGWTLIETSTGIIHGFVARVNAGLVDMGKSSLSRSQNAIMTVIVLILAIVLSKFGIIDLIAKGYNTMSYGLMIVYILPMLTIGLYKIVKSKK
ncbi:YkvI family membrane protein [Intestinibacter sp.]